MKKLVIAVSLLMLSTHIPAFAQEAEKVASDEVADNAETSADVAEKAAPVVAKEQPAMRKASKGPVNFGDFKSSTLTTKAWEAMENNDIESVLAYTNKCLELYGETARKMQAGMTEFASGTQDDIFKMWALNDVATCLYIQGEAYRRANMKDEAKEAYNKVVKDFGYAQTWDPKGWFWKPAEAAKEKLAMIESGIEADFGDYTSSTLVTKAWESLEKKDLAAVKLYVNKTIELYGEKAKEMQGSLKEYAWDTKDKEKEKIFSYWALNDVGTALFVLGQANQDAGNKEDAAAAYKKLIDEYFYAQCWDPNGWFWKPAEAAQQKLGELDNV